MIIKLFGMAIIMISSVLMGFSFAECMASRERELCNLADAIDLMIGELGYTHLAIKDIFFKISPMVRGETAELFGSICSAIERGESIAYAWTNSLDTKAQAMSLKGEDVSVLKKSSYLLEAYELEEQKNNLMSLKSRVESLASDASESKRKNSRIVKMLGIYGGILLCIIVF